MSQEPGEGGRVDRPGAPQDAPAPEAPAAGTGMPAGGEPGGAPGAATGAETSTGLEPKLAGLLCYVLGLITGIVFLIVEKKSGFVRFHALQSTVVFGALFILGWILPVIPLIGFMLSMLMPLVALILWILLMVKAYQGERFKLPVVGDWVEQQLAKGSFGG